MVGKAESRGLWLIDDDQGFFDLKKIRRGDQGDRVAGIGWDASGSLSAPQRFQTAAIFSHPASTATTGMTHRPKKIVH